MTTAGVLSIRSTELHVPQSPGEVEAVPPTLPVSPVSPVPPIVKPRSCQKRVLLLASETALESEVREALRIRQQDRDSGLFF